MIIKLMLTARYLDDLLNIDNPYIKGMINQIYPPELQLNKANTTDTEAPNILKLHLSVANDLFLDLISVISFLDGDVPRRAFYFAYVSQLINFDSV